MRAYYVYILTSVNRNVMYVGVTNNLENRVAQHRSGEGGAFTRRYRVHTLVHAEEYQYVEDAITREKEIKGLETFEERRAGRSDQSKLGRPVRDAGRHRSLASLGMTQVGFRLDRNVF
ncbi:MAG TPA: GIY-YIG nuclease family protein [Reyranella sp.]|nr:GIY-YIG nuclease family protein [Reyranella sp.]